MSSHTLLTGFAFLLFIQFISTWLIGALHIPFPPALFGMLLLAILLLTGALKKECVEDICVLLIEKMSMLFVPGAVGMLLYIDLIKKEWLAIFATVFISTAVVILATGLFVEMLLRRREGKKNA